MKLVVAEKPSVGLEIAKALGCSHRGEGYIEGEGYVISWAAGHLVELKAPEEYDAAWSWRNSSWATLPMIPSKYELKVSAGGRKQFSVLRKLFARKDVRSVINACDAGREGELIFDYIYRLAGSALPVERLWTSAALTRDAILAEFGNLKSGERFGGLRYAARARAAADWLVGMNGTRAVTLAARGPLFSVGRVQTPTLAFLVEREKLIRDFVPEAFQVIEVQFEPPGDRSFVTRYEFPVEGGRSHQVKNAVQAKAVVSALEDPAARYFVAENVERRKADRPPLLFDLTTLQREANRAFGFPAEKTLSLAQALYERHKALTYPRTDSRHLPEAMRPELPAVLDALSAQGYPQEAVTLAKERRTRHDSRVFDDSKVSDHHALLPTRVAPKGLSGDEARIHRMVALRLLAVFQDDLVTSITDIAIGMTSAEHLFHAQGRVVLQAGWMNVERPPAPEKKQTDTAPALLPKLAKGDGVALVGHTLKDDVTKPPRRYTDADLLSLMENAGNRLSDGGDREILRGRGIGTPATRAGTIGTLLKRDYALRSGKVLVPTEKAMALIENLRALPLKSAAMTAQWENDLAAIERGELRPALFAEKLNAFVRELVSGARASTFAYRDEGKRDKENTERQENTETARPQGIGAAPKARRRAPPRASAAKRKTP